MTMPDEEQRALEAAEKFLTELLHGRYTLKEDRREMARRILRHYPGPVRIAMLYKDVEGNRQ